MANIREQIAQDGKAIPLRGGFGKFNNFLPTPSPTVTPSNRPTPTQTPTQTSTQTNTRTPTRTKSRKKLLFITENYFSYQVFIYIF